MKRQFVALIAVILCVWCWAGVVNAQSDTAPTPVGSYVIRDNIYVRGGPSEAYTPVGSLRAGSPLRPVSQNEGGTWVLIAYNRGFGWIRRDLGYWNVDIDALPVVLEPDLTPTFVAGSETPTPFLTTPTPVGNWINVGELGAFVRTGPGFRYPIYGELDDGDIVEPVGRNADGSWILIRMTSGFAWINRTLVEWVDELDTLPILQINALTPSATFTVTATPSITTTLEPSATPTDPPTITSTATSTMIPPSATLTETTAPTNTPSPTFAASVTESVTPSPTITASATVTIIATPTFTLTLTSTASVTAQATVTPSLTATLAPTDTQTSTATSTDTLIPPSAT